MINMRATYNHEMGMPSQVLRVSIHSMAFSTGSDLLY